MKKPNKLYRRWLKNYRADQAYRAWLYDTFPATFPRKEFRSWFKRTRILFYSSLVVVFVPMFVWSLLKPFWNKYDYAVYNFVDRFDRTPMVFFGFSICMFMCFIGLGCAYTHYLAWPLVMKIAIYCSVMSIFALLSNVVYRCFEGCPGNFCRHRQVER